MLVTYLGSFVFEKKLINTNYCNTTMSNNDSTHIIAGHVQSSEVNIELTGKTVSMPSNFVTAFLYKYRCVSNTSLGTLILGASISETMQNSMHWMERFDFIMHYLGCFVFISLLTGINKFSLAERVFFAIPVILHHLNLLVVMVFFAIPLNRAKNLALVAPTQSTDPINGSMNEFVTITATQTDTYAMTDFQKAVVAQASKSGTIKLMLYNKSWSAKYVHPAGRLNAFIHLLPFLIAVTAPRDIGGIVAAYFLYLFIWYVIMYCSKSVPACFDFLFCPLACLFAGCTPSEDAILARVQEGSAKEAIDLEHIELSSCGCVKYF